MRCPDCNKFVSFSDEPEVEADFDLVDGILEGEVRVVLTCSECGTELKETTFEVSEELNHECGEDEDCGGFEIESEDICSSSEYNNMGKNGKILKNGKMLYGYTGTVQVKCCDCEEIIEIEIGEVAESSSFEECY